MSEYAKLKEGVLCYAPKTYVSEVITINNFNEDVNLMKEFGYKAVVYDGYLDNKYTTTEVIEEVSDMIIIHKVLDNSEEILGDIKNSLIDKTKINLAAYLENNPLISDAKGGVEKEYTVTAEKQNQLTSTVADFISNALPYIIQALTKDVLGDYLANYMDELPIDIYWNSRGDTCEKWKYSEIFKLKNDMMLYVRPCVEYQRYLEKIINLCSTQVDLFNLDLSFTKDKIEIFKSKLAEQN